MLQETLTQTAYALQNTLKASKLSVNSKTINVKAIEFMYLSTCNLFTVEKVENGVLKQMLV